MLQMRSGIGSKFSQLFRHRKHAKAIDSIGNAVRGVPYRVSFGGSVSSYQTVIATKCDDDYRFGDDRKRILFLATCPRSGESRVECQKGRSLAFLLALDSPLLLAKAAQPCWLAHSRYSLTSLYEKNIVLFDALFHNAP